MNEDCSRNGSCTRTKYSYDAAGNLLNDGYHNYQYDAENRIVSVDGGATTYVYDAEGRRFSKTTGSAIVGTIYDREGRPLFQTNNFGPRAVFVAGMHLGTYIVNSAHTDTIFYYDHSDWLGTERARTDLSGTPCEQIASLPFGDNQTINSTCGDLSPLHFTGKEHDSESGLDYFGARHYASAMGRFISPDRYNVMLTRQGLEAGGLPSEAADAFLNGYAANPQNWNQYAYVRNNPLSFVDPTGAAAIPGGDGHHLIPQAIMRTLSSPIARDFVDKVKTGPPNVAPNYWNEEHIAYNNAVEEVLEEAEQTMGDRNAWSIAQWKDVATQVLNSQVPAIRNFLDELNQNNPNARAALAAAIAGYQLSAAFIARTIAAALGSAIVRLPLIIYVDVQSAFRHPDEEADRKPPHPRCLMTREGQCVE